MSRVASLADNAITRRGDRAFVELSVEDKGNGVPWGAEDRLFERFLTSKPSGSGRGLAIVSQIVREHRGRVRVDNVPGEGVTFHFDLPAEKGRPCMNQQAKVLIVDDEEDLCHLYREELESEGYSVRAVNEVPDAMRIVQEDPPDVVVMDIRMPRIDGIEAMGRMLSIRNDLPVILNSAYSFYQDDFRAWPAADYVIKSSDLTELKGAIRKALSSAGALTGS